MLLHIFQNHSYIKAYKFIKLYQPNCEISNHYVFSSITNSIKTKFKQANIPKSHIGRLFQGGRGAAASEE